MTTGLRATISAPAFKAAVRVVSRAAATRPQVPINGAVKLDSQDGELRLVATDLDIAVSQWIPAESSSTGSIALSAVSLSAWADAVAGDEVVITEGRTRHSFTCGDASASFPALVAEHFPLVVEPVGNELVITDVPAFADALRYTAHAADGPGGRPALSGIHVKGDGEQVSIAATDGYRLSLAWLPLAWSGEAILPPRFVVELARNARPNEPATLSVSPSRVSLAWPKVHVLATLIQGQFPSYEAILPKEGDWRVRVRTTKGAALAALQAVLPAAKEGAGVVGVLAAEGALRFIVDGEADAAEATCSVPAALEIREPMRQVRLAASYLLDALNAMPEGDISIAFPATGKPVAVSGASRVEVIMPRSSWS